MSVNIRCNCCKKRLDSSNDRLSDDVDFEIMERGDDPLPLTWEKAAELQGEFGKNILASQKPPKWYYILFQAAVQPFNGILMVLAIVSVATQDYRTFTVMVLMIVISTVLQFVQEFKSAKEAHGLQSLVTSTTTVLRRGSRPRTDGSVDSGFSSFEGDMAGGDDDHGAAAVGEHVIAVEDVVVGDVVTLTAGSLIPADMRIIESRDLFVSQSSLTGESMPLEKYPLALASAAAAAPPPPRGGGAALLVNATPSLEAGASVAVLARPHLCFMGSSVVSGLGRGVVLRIGARTVVGHLASKLAQGRPLSAFQKGVRRVAAMFGAIIALMVPLVLVLNGAIAGDWLQAFLFAIAVGVGLTPEMLSMIVSTNLARGAVVMARANCIVKRFTSIVNFGGIDVMCTDKTGTLTQDKVVLMHSVDITGEQSNNTLRIGYLNARFQTGLKNLLDHSVIEHFEKEADAKASVENKYVKLDELPFDFVRRRMSVLLEDTGTRAKIIVSKGAVTEMMEVCETYLAPDGATLPLTPAQREEVLKMNDRYNTDGLRVIAVAQRGVAKGPSNIRQTVFHEEISSDSDSSSDGSHASRSSLLTSTNTANRTLRTSRTSTIVADELALEERNMVFVGFLLFLDPPKDSAAPAIKELMERGVTVKVLTGDSPAVCLKVCDQVGLPVTGVATTNDLRGLNDDQLADLAERTTVFARLTPIEKSRVVEALRSRGHIVGFLGDGINDAGALRAADVGISVDSAVAVAKDCADIILLEKSLMVLAHAVVLGRTTFGNTLKYIMMALSSNFGNVFSVTIASAWLPFLPMLPVHIVVQNMLYDISQISIPWDHMDESFLAAPRTWNTKKMLRFMICLGPISSIFDITTFIFMWYYIGMMMAVRITTGRLARLWTKGILSVRIMCTISVCVMRPSTNHAVWNTFCWSTVFACERTEENMWYLQMVPPPAIYYPYLLGANLGYCLFVHVRKMVFLRVFKHWF